jgi:hypothetical protein
LHALFLLSALALAQAPRAADAAFVELVPERDTLYVGELLRVRVRFGFERELLERHMIQPFQRRLDVPAQVQLPGHALLSCAEPIGTVESAPGAAPGLSFALDEEIALAVRAGELERDGAIFSVFESVRVYRATCSGRIVLPAPILVYATAGDLREDVFGNRQPVERSDLALNGAELTLEVLPLPDAGRPADFGGAVGSFNVSAVARPVQVHQGESLKLDLVVKGTGDLRSFEAPRLEGLEGFQTRGWVEALAPGSRTITYDLVPRDPSVRAVPPISFSFFDPGPAGGYRTVATAPVALEILPERSMVPAGDGQPQGRPAPAGDAADESKPLRWLWLLVFVPLLLAGRRRRRQASTSRAPDAAPRVHRAAEQFRARANEADPLGNFTSFLALVLDCPEPAVVGADLAGRLTRAGVPAELAERCAHLHEELVGARYGGSTQRGAAETRQLVDELEAG